MNVRQQVDNLRKAAPVLAALGSVIPDSVDTLVTLRPASDLVEVQLLRVAYEQVQEWAGALARLAGKPARRAADWRGADVVYSWSVSLAGGTAAKLVWVERGARQGEIRPVLPEGPGS